MNYLKVPKHPIGIKGLSELIFFSGCENEASSQGARL